MDAMTSFDDPLWLYAEYWGAHIRLCPGGPCLGSWSSQGRPVQHFVFDDEHVFRGDVVDELLCEFREVVRWYFGEPQGAEGQRESIEVAAVK